MSSAYISFEKIYKTKYKHEIFLRSQHKTIYLQNDLILNGNEAKNFLGTFSKKLVI